MTEKSLLKPFEPMLAAPRGDPDACGWPVVVQPKYDGIRCVIKDGVALTRKLEPIPNQFISMTLSDPRLNGLDGELIVGRPLDKDCYNKTGSVVMSFDGDPTDCVFYVFDDFSFPRQSYAMRLAQACVRTDVDAPIIRGVHAHIARDYDELHRIEETHVREGWEGVIVRDGRAMYKHGRATEKENTLWKMKRFNDDEMLVHAIEERMHNGNEAEVSKLGRSKRGHAQAGKIGTGQLGCLVGTSPKWPGQEIRVGSSNLPRIGYDEAAAMFLGKLVKFKHQPAGAKDKPRFPVYVGLRSPLDV